MEGFVMEKKYQVFVSSTFEDLKDERNDIIRSVLEIGHIPVGMEMFSAADEEQWKIIARTIDAADYYVVILAHRYGSESKGVSYTEKEFDYATAAGIPVLGFIIDEAASWPSTKTDTDAKKRKKLCTFKTKVKGKMVQFWSSREDLRAKFAVALMKSILTNPRTGWVRADEVAGPSVTKELTRLSSENAALRAEVQASKQAAAEKEDIARATMKILDMNQMKFNVRRTAEWNDSTVHSRTLAQIFEYVAPDLINENSSLGVARNIALHNGGTGYYNNWPVGRNQTSGIIADLSALDLVEPSKRKHAVDDQNSYWSLTPLGRRMLKQFRRLRLEEGLMDTESAEEESEGAESGLATSDSPPGIPKSE
jgi:hypothetical protein